MGDSWWQLSIWSGHAGDGQRTRCVRRSCHGHPHVWITQRQCSVTSLPRRLQELTTALLVFMILFSWTSSELQTFYGMLPSQFICPGAGRLCGWCVVFSYFLVWLRKEWWVVIYLFFIFSLCHSGFNSQQEHSKVWTGLFMPSFLITKLSAFLSSNFCRKNIWFSY